MLVAVRMAAHLQAYLGWALVTQPGENLYYWLIKKLNIKFVAYSSQRSHTGQLDFYN